MTLTLWKPRFGLSHRREHYNRWLGDEIFDDFFRAALGREAYTPAVDIKEEEDKWTVTAELPGLSREEIHVEVKDGNLTLSGESKAEETVEEKGFTLKERWKGAFTRSFRLPDTADEGKISATYNDGLLHVDIPKAEEVKPKQIKIAVN